MRATFFLLLPLIIFTGCYTTTKIIKYTERSDEAFANNTLKDLLKTNKSPKIFLRVSPDQNKGKSNAYLYVAMENELLKQGFSVKDRVFFNEILNKADPAFAGNKDKLQTDLILEVVNIEDRVIYSTNKVTAIGKSRTIEEVQDINFKSYGAYVEYRLITVINNELAGSYKYNYQPCLHGCLLNSFNMEGPRRNRRVVLDESLPADVMKHFITNSIQHLMSSLKES